ncbi:probable RNA-binding protein EIF1AD [Mytilus trossulus]|uniref:probable RNA-binding protein EIF1AD n=1 Tax=Mytilus trossulus TaxID=6551 RepID=UPI003003AEB5
MSKATKRKHVTKEVLDEYVLPEENQQIVKVVAGKGNNLHEILTADNRTFLVSMPTRFRKNVWIKRGDFVFIEPIEEGDRVKAEISRILYKDQIKYIKEEGKWPEAFMEITNTEKDQMIPDDMLPPCDSSDEDVGDLVVNANRQKVAVYEESDNETSEEDDDVT